MRRGVLLGSIAIHAALVPPRLVYPRRERQSDEAETFMARLTVDADGYVVGARLVRGVGGRATSSPPSSLVGY